MTTTRGEILVIDDDELVRETLQDVLEEAGYSVVTAADGQSGFQTIVDVRPDVVLCDVRMPGKNGYEVLKEVRQSGEEIFRTPFIFLSALADMEYIAAGYKIGADDYVAKPVEPRLLRMKVDALFRQLDRLGAGHGPNPASGSDETRETEARARVGGDRNADAPSAADEIARAAKRGRGMSGSVQLVSLEEFREMFGEEWERLRDKALAITESIIRKGLDPNDVYTSYDNDGFLILFKGLDEKDAQRRVTALADEVRVRLLGEDHASYRHLEISAIAVDVEELLDANGNLDFGLLADAHNRARRSEEASGASPEAAPVWFKDQLSVAYMPVWSAAREAVAAFQAVPIRTTPYGELRGRSVLHGGASDPWAVLVDEFLVESLAPYFDASSPYSDVAALCLPLHFHSLAEDAVERLDHALAAFSPELARHRLIIQIIGMPEFRGSANLQRAVHWAKGYCQHVSVELPPEDRHVAIARGAGADILHLETPAVDDEEKHKELLKQLQQDGAKLKRLGMRALVDNVDRLDQFAVARTAGFTFLSGKTIGASVEGPRPPYSLPISRITG